MPAFVIVTTGDLPEAYFLAAFLVSRAQRFAMVNIVARSLVSQLRILARLRRKRGTRYLADLLLARATDLGRAAWPRRAKGHVPAFPEVDARLIDHVRSHSPRLDCHDPHAPSVLAYVRDFAPDYVLLAGCPVLRPSFYGLARHAALNRHLGLVPDFRGSDCAMWSFAVGRPESAGYSIHVVDERVDAGDVIVRHPVPVRDDRSLGEYLRRLRREASIGFVDVLDQIVQGVPVPRAPQDGRGQYFPPAGWSTRRRAERTFAGLTARRPSPENRPVPPSRPVTVPAVEASPR